MRIRSLGLAMAGGVLLGMWIAASPAIAAPKTPIGATSRVNLTLAQQDLASAWYRELGKIKREGLDAARHGKDRAVKSAIEKAGIVVMSAKHGEGALGTLPNSIREQIAAAGRRVARTLSARRSAAGHASRPAKRRSRQTAPPRIEHTVFGAFTIRRDENGDAIYFFVAANQDHDLDVNRSDQDAVKGVVVNDRDADLGSQPIRRPKSTSHSGASKPRSKSSSGGILDDPVALFFGGLPLLSALFSTPPAEIEEWELRNAPIYYSEAQVALSRGPSASREPQEKFDSARSALETLANPKFTRSARVRALARLYLSRLPDHYVPGYAFMHGDGTVAADPDPFIRLLLARGGDLLLIRGGGPGEGAK